MINKESFAKESFSHYDNIFRGDETDTPIDRLESLLRK